eukprot:scaffold33310_cov17-Tisochrysis_lutea.AAC.1
MLLGCKFTCVIFLSLSSYTVAGQQAVHRKPEHSAWDLLDKPPPRLHVIRNNVPGADLDGATRSPLFDRLANAWNMGSVFKTRLQLWANQESHYSSSEPECSMSVPFEPPCSILEGFLWWREQQLQESHSVPDANSPSYRIVGGRAVENAARYAGMSGAILLP